jgi:ankyrin repeat protein
MGWPSRLSYQQVVATGIARSLPVLAAYGDLDTAAAVLTADPSLSDDPEALAAAATGGHDAIVRLLLRHRPRLAERVAVVARSRELTELLFQSGMNPNLTAWLGVTALHRFAREGNVEGAAIFLDHGANLHARDEEFCTTPLGYAAAAGKLRMVEFLLQRGAQPTLPDDLAWATPIALATYRGHDAVVRVLRAHAK